MGTVYRYAGFRAHYLVPVESGNGEPAQGKESRESGNVLTCDILREVEDTFSVVIQFYQKGLAEQTEYSLLTYETGKEDWARWKKQCAEGEIRLRIPDGALIWMKN